MTDSWWDKAENNLGAAQLLCERAFHISAINRAYYAMYDAARAALSWKSATLGEAKTHSEVIGRFSKFIVRGVALNRKLGRSFNKASEMRLVADYKLEPVLPEDARAAVQSATEFLAAIGPFLTRVPK